MSVNRERIIYSTPLDEPKKNSQNLVPFINYQIPAPTRCVDMLLKKYYNQSFQSEVMMHAHSERLADSLKVPLSKATIAVITDGGLVPKSNPDRLPSVSSRTYKAYSIAGLNQLEVGQYEVSHQGYDPTYVEENPNRLIPVDVLRKLEQEHIIGKLHDEFLTTSGVMTPVEDCKRIGNNIVKYLKTKEIDAAIVLSTCGTSARCGGFIALAIQQADIPVVQVAQLAQIPESMGVNRIYKGSNVSYPLGDTELSVEYEERLRENQVLGILEMLTK